MLAFILSQPRSGSTVLSAMLDRRKGVVCLPESSFPQVLGTISRNERQDKRWLAALYLGSTFPPRPKPPTPLTIDDAEACMNGSNEEILIALGKAVAAKIGHDPADVNTVIWKTTRNIGMHRGPLSTSGKFVVLRRHLHNIYDSQFRVDFGIRNRNPYRFGVFTQSYEHAFSRLPSGRTFELNYEEIPRRFSDLLQFLGVKDQGEWESGHSTIDLVAQSGGWLAQATQAFCNDDPEKRAGMDAGSLNAVDSAMFWTRPLRPLMGPVRRYFDKKSMRDNRSEALLHFQGKFPTIDISTSS
jgi:hypothetical protein